LLISGCSGEWILNFIEQQAFGNKYAKVSNKKAIFKINIALSAIFRNFIFVLP
jgi:hypothetical protein